MAESSLYKMAHLCELIARTPWPDILLGCVRDDPDGNRMVCRLLGTWAVMLDHVQIVWLKFQLASPLGRTWERCASGFVQRLELVSEICTGR